MYLLYRAVKNQPNLLIFYPPDKYLPSLDAGAGVYNSSGVWARIKVRIGQSTSPSQPNTPHNKIKFQKRKRNRYTCLQTSRVHGTKLSVSLTF